ncbi:hypothetical protein [Streptomyces cavernicola]|uniref:Uncharacterized protein n=1 Tax=Streptomyces cavernicola TaxID=3043613 RepID=A0ABT6S648_9ACTN|nr:hypothetical protein [Streptomyces sp. B-S-A6]MDI3403565.1 hypothetical protein [Streptomyces sp. B-S-A6]
MSLQDDLTAVQRCLDELVRSVGRLEQHVGGGVDLRRVRTDTDHLRDSLALLREAAPELASRPRPEVIHIPDQPYDRALWSDVDDEGLGASDRRAP